MECTICGRKFGANEDRRLIVCEHGEMLCPCRVYGYACLSHDHELPRLDRRENGLRMAVLELPGDWKLVTVMSGRQVVSAHVRMETAA